MGKNNEDYNKRAMQRELLNLESSEILMGELNTKAMYLWIRGETSNGLLKWYYEMRAKKVSLQLEWVKKERLSAKRGIELLDDSIKLTE